MSNNNMYKVKKKGCDTVYFFSAPAQSITPINLSLEKLIYTLENNKN